MIVGYRIKNDIAGYYLELNPLQNISDEHAIELAKNRYNDLKLLTFIHIGKTIISEYLKGKDYLTVKDYQYLQSKSYAIDWFCPIENRIIPVQEQIDNGWITLKTE